MKTRIMALLLLSSLLQGCSDKRTPFKYDNIKAVYYHEGNLYSFARMNPTSTNSEVEMLRFGGWMTRVRIFTDVAPSNSMWIEGDMVKEGGGGIHYEYDIHIHSVDDVNTGGWNHGKFGRGTTTRIQ